MTGLSVLQQLRSDGDRVGVIMITAARELDTVSAALDGGAADYLIKPFEFPQLQAKLEAFAARADALESDRGVDQSLIDSLFGGAGGRGRIREPLPKGLGVETGRLVLAAVRVAGEVSAAECAETVGISRVSARRYLEHYLSTGTLETPAAVRGRPTRTALPRGALTGRVGKPWFVSQGKQVAHYSRDRQPSDTTLGGYVDAHTATLRRSR